MYDNLIAAVHSKLPALYRYYDLRRRKMKLKDIHHYDTYVPILSELNVNHTWEQAVKTVVESLEPLGDEYCRVLDDGLTRGAGATAIRTRASRAGRSVAARSTAIRTS